MVTKFAHVERERAIGVLKANVTPLVVANWTSEESFPTNWDNVTPSTSRAATCVSKRRQDPDIQTSHLGNRFHLESVTARTSQGTHNPKIRAQTVRIKFKRFV